MGQGAIGSFVIEKVVRKLFGEAITIDTDNASGAGGAVTFPETVEVDNKCNPTIVSGEGKVTFDGLSVGLMVMSLVD